MKVRVARILGRANIGGPARSALLLARRLAPLGFETLLIAGAEEPGEGDLFAGAGDVRVARVAALRRRPGPLDLAAAGRIRELLEEFAPHVVHTHAAKAGVLGRRAALALRGRRPPAARPRLVHTFHGHVLDGYFPRPLAWLFARIERRLARVTDQLVAVAPQVAGELALRHGVAPRARFAVIENGIELAPYQVVDAGRRSAARRLLGAAAAAILVLVPARLAPVKDHRLLFAAVRRLPRRLAPLELHLLGDGPLRGALERAASRLPAEVKVRFHGFRDDLPEVLPAADVVVLASRNEGMPLALIEAMACGLPVVAPAVGGVPDLVAHGVTGLLAAPGDPDALAFALARVLEDLPLAQRLGAAGRQQALARHDAGAMVAAHAALYRRLLAAAPAGAGVGASG